MHVYMRVYCECVDAEVTCAPAARYINHDCSPNTARFDYFDKADNALAPKTLREDGDGVWGTRVELRSMEALEAGSEVRISYTGMSFAQTQEICLACRRGRAAYQARAGGQRLVGWSVGDVRALVICPLYTLLTGRSDLTRT